jgi:ribosomal peptide maturation radical SAM protein 1
MKKVLLLSMPFGALERPALGLSLLKARLAETGVACDVRYLTFPLAEFIGCADYQWINFELPYTAFAGDWTFTEALYGERPEADERYAREVLLGQFRLDEAAIRRLQRVRALIPHFLAHCLAAVPWEDYAVVGFTSTFEQNIASLALAKRLKAAHPDIAIVFGGANWEGEMGEELHRQFEFVDYVCSGEAERSFPALVARLLADAPVSEPPIPGVVYRGSNGSSVATGPAELIRDLDALPIPDYSDYFRDLALCSAAAGVYPILLFETSRGCWWGAKSHCTFCGLNGGTMAFRSKSPRRALDELEYLVERWQTEIVEAVDNILDMKYFNHVLPALARAGRSWQIFYEVKANLNRAQLRLLRAAGVTRIQPGIESLSDHVLQLMRKGTTALKNVQLLKWCQEEGITMEWNIIYGFPGETRRDYDEMLSLLGAIRFLRPPTGCGPVRMDRFSPYFNTPGAFGLRNVRPIAAYRYLYPFSPESLTRVAYYFDFDYEAQVDPTSNADQVVAYVTAWRRAPETGTLRALHRPDGALALLDTRADAAQSALTLAGAQRAAYEYCDEAHSVADLTRHLRRSFPEQTFSEAQIQCFLDALVARKLMVTDGKRYLSLALFAAPEQSV